MTFTDIPKGYVLFFLSQSPPQPKKTALDGSQRFKGNRLGECNSLFIFAPQTKMISKCGICLIVKRL
jgi:hypothetical protein